MNYRLTVAYDGTRYLGWQKQGERDSREYLRTIQGKLEHVLSELFGEEISVQGAGRTDAGVHAAAQVANFRTKGLSGRDILPEEVFRYVNTYLPDDVAVLSVKRADERFHARLNATGKRYVYKILNSSVSDVFAERYEYRVEEPLDIEAMREAAKRFLGRHDFKYFSADKTKKSTVREVYDIEIRVQPASELAQDAKHIEIEFHGNGFLRYMVRIMTGTLIEVGKGVRAAESISEILAAAEVTREAAGYTAPAKGLTLKEVEYDE